ncbi:MAG: RNase adapter RapZ, partial [Neisseriaceae bacterium]|nr:RNase adapter RapZ [Neisseriaceae bacterium]
EAKHEVLVKRFSETRRRHPLTHTGLTVAECIYKERELLERIAELGTRIDTSHISSNILKTWIKNFINGDKQRVNLIFESFGFKHGVPLDADFVFDVRCLPNPYYDVNLRHLTGQSQAIVDFFADKPAVHDMTADIEAYVRKWLPAFANEHRSYLTIAIGCTGGQHRSVFIAETLAQRFSAESVLLRHRQLGI